MRNKKNEKVIKPLAFEAAAKPPFVAKLAEKYSDDPGSAKSGGSLGFIGRGRTVLIDVSFVEMVRTGHHNLGVSYPQLMGGSAQVQGTISLYPKANAQNSTVALQLAGPQTSAQLNMLSENGAVRTLAQPRLVCSSTTVMR